MVSDHFCTYVLSLFKQTSTAYAQLHTSDPGPDGLLGGCNDSRRLEVVWGAQEGPELVSSNSLIWSEVQGIPGFPQLITHITLWAAPFGGKCWAVIPISPIRVPHLATLEIPAGMTLRLAS